MDSWKFMAKKPKGKPVVFLYLHLQNEIILYLMVVIICEIYMFNTYIYISGMYSIYSMCLELRIY